MAKGVVVDFKANTAQFTNGVDKSVMSLNKLKSQAATAGKAIGVAFAAAAAATAYLVKQSIDSADAMTKLSRSTGVAIETLSGLSFAAELSGSNTEALGAAMVKLVKGMADATIGTGEAMRGYEALGINVKDAAGNLKNADAVMKEVANKFAGMEDGANKTALAVAIFGKSGAGMVSMLNNGAQGLQDMQDEAAALGLVLDREAGEAAERFNDDLTRLNKVKEGFANQIMKEMLPALTDITKAMTLAARESGVLKAAWVGLGGIGAALFTDEFDTPAEQAAKKIVDLRGELGALERHREQTLPGHGGYLQKWLYGTTEEIDTKIAATKKQIADLQAQLDKPAAAPKPEKKPDAPMMKSLAEINKAGKAGKAGKAAELKDFDQHIKEFQRMQEEAQSEMTRSALAAQAIYADVDPIYKAGLAWEKYMELVKGGYLDLETAGKAYAQSFGEATDTMTEFAKRAGENIQDAFAEFLFDPFAGGVQGMMDNFTTMLRKMAAEALASQILGSIGSWGKTGGGAGSAIGSIAAAVFGGGKAGGGPVSGGTTYLVGERGPELFTPSGSGNITPNDKMGKSVTVINNFTISTPTDRRTQEQIAAMAGASIQSAMMRGA